MRFLRFLCDVRFLRFAFGINPAAENPGFVDDFWAFETKKTSTFDHIDYNVLSHQFFHIVFSKK